MLLRSQAMRLRSYWTRIKTTGRVYFVVGVDRCSSGQMCCVQYSRHATHSTPLPPSHSQSVGITLRTTEL